MIAFTNPGGIRSDIPRKDDGAVTYGDVFASQPFRNQLVTLTLTGAQIKNMLEQQWLDPKRPRILQVSSGFSYAWDGARPIGERVSPISMSLNGQRIDPATSYRVTVNNYLAVGGDGFTVFKKGSRRRSASTTSTPCTPISGPTARSRPRRRPHRAGELNEAGDIGESLAAHASRRSRRRSSA